jgi:hypothetical protein
VYPDSTGTSWPSLSMTLIVMESLVLPMEVIGIPNSSEISLIRDSFLGLEVKQIS